MTDSTSVLDSLPAIGAAQSAPPPSGSSGSSSATSILDSLQPVAAPQAQQAAPSWADQLWGGIKRGVIGMANAPVTLLNAEGDLIKNTVNAGAGKEVLPEGQIAGLPPPSSPPPPQTLTGKIAARVGEFLPGAVAGGAGEGSALAGIGRQIIPSILGGAGSAIAENAAPESLKPLASMVGGVAGGVGGAAAQEGAAATIARPLANKAMTTAGRMGIGAKQDIGGISVTPQQAQAAGQQISQALGPEGVGRLTKPVTLPGVQDQLVPGSQPTTAQVAQTPGAVGLEKAYRVATPEPFLQRAQNQNTARLGAIQSLAPANAQPAAVGAFFRQQLDQLDQAGQQATQQAQAGVRQATDALGGTQPTAAYGEQARTALQMAQAPIHAATQRLWSAVDPNGTWALPAGAAKTTAQQLVSDISPTAQTDAQETALLQRAAGLPPVVKFGDLGDMRADINAAMRRLSGTPGMEPNVRRLTILKQSVDQSISDALDGRAAQEAQAVAAGQMAPEQTQMANLQRQVSNWYAARNATASSQAAGGYSGGNLFQAPGRGSSAASGLSGTTSQAGGRSGGAPGIAGLPGQAQPLEPNFTQEHADAYQAAVGATRQEKQTFGQGAVGQVLRPGRQGEEYAVQAGAVPGKIFTRGPTEPGEVQRFITAVGGPDQASQIGRETLANELRQTNVIKPDGTLDAARFATWQARRQPTIQQFPGLGDQFASAETAQRTLDDVSAAHQSALKDFQNSAAARFINDDPHKAVGAAFGSSNPTATFGQLVRQVRSNADAEAGLKRAVVDYITEKTRSATPAGEVEDFQKAATFRNFVRQNSGALKALFGGQGVQNLDMVAADLRRQAQQTTATAGSDTAQKITAARKLGLMDKTKHASALGVLMLAGEHLGGAIHGGMLGSLAGAVALPVAGEMLHSMRQAGISTVNDLVREAMLHPNVARELMAKTQNGSVGPVASQRIARALQGIMVSNSTQQERQQ